MKIVNKTRYPKGQLRDIVIAAHARHAQRYGRLDGWRGLSVLIGYTKSEAPRAGAAGEHLSIGVPRSAFGGAWLAAVVEHALLSLRRSGHAHGPCCITPVPAGYEQRYSTFDHLVTEPVPRKLTPEEREQRRADRTQDRIDNMRRRLEMWRIKLARAGAAVIRIEKQLARAERAAAARAAAPRPKVLRKMNLS